MKLKYATAALSGFLSVLLAGAVSSRAAGETLIADFEGDTYAGWVATGDAFGDRPAQGAFPGQMPVAGFLGRGLVNSFRGGDDATGTLTSPPFRIVEPYVNFLIGGGGFAGETSVELKVDGRVVRKATGPNVNPGGSEQLRWQTWDVSEFRGQDAVLSIIDRRKGGWGHINADHFVQSDQPREARPASRELRIEHRYLHLPVRTGAAKVRLRLVDPSAGEASVLREFEIEYDAQAPSFWTFLDLNAYRGKSLRIEADALESEPGKPGLNAITQADDVPEAANLYHEPHRPQFHFTSRRGWLNDPNGLVWQDGTYHLYYQHNPFGWNWGNMHWGHATSPDLVHWTEQPIALHPPRFGDWCFSGSGFIDKANTAGFVAPDSKTPPLVVAFTSTGRGECIAFSTDGGQTFREPAFNPVISHNGRDPKVFWHKPSKTWVMAVYDEDGDRRRIAFFNSTDLKTWNLQSRIDGFFECPDLFELPVAGEPDQRLWVLLAADAKYVLGDFDGKTFTPRIGSPENKLTLWHGNYYASQSYSNAPNDRRIQVGWGQGIVFPDMPFNQQMAVPCELSLRKTANGPRLFAEPVRELAGLRQNSHTLNVNNETLRSGIDPLAGVRGELFDVTLKLSVGPEASGTLSLNLRGVPLVYDAGRRVLSCRDVTAPLAPDEEGRVEIRALLDRGSIEAFGNRGQVAMSVGVIPNDDQKSLGLRLDSDAIEVRGLQVFELGSAWNSNARTPASD
jgi:fructan beta-fructosidase